MNKNTPAVGHSLAIVAMLIWGTTFIATKVLLVDFGPLEILFVRFVLGYLALLAIHPRFVKSKSIKEELVFAAAGLCGVTLYYLTESIALTYTQASNVGVIVSVSPMFTAILAHFFLRGERLHPRFVGGFVVAIGGICLISFNGSMVLQLNPLGDILALTSAFCWAVYSIISRKISDMGHHTLAATRRIFFYGLLFMLPALFWMDFSLDVTRLTVPVNLLNLLYLGLGASTLCFVCWNRAVGILGAVKTSVYIYSIPAITIAASALILRERITWLSLLGAMLTVGGLFFSQRRPAHSS